MYKNVMQKWGLCFILMLCPRRIRLQSPPVENCLSNYYYELSQTQQSFPAELNVDDVRYLNEPGFDLTDEEMVKLKIWPHGVIPYYIDVYSYSDKVLRDKIRSFLSMVNSLTSLNFLELPSPPADQESRWVFFVNRRGLLSCADHSSKNFTNQGVQQVVLGYDCMSTGGELAEAVLAVVGVPAQHNAPNRDKFVQIVKDNIIPEKRYLFEKIKNDEWLFHGVGYDFTSAGHYHFHKYSVNGRSTIKPQNRKLDLSVGERNGLSNLDILKIKMLYNYEANKKQNISDCHILFEPGSRFNDYQPNVQKTAPRKKPPQYLGFNDKENNISGDENEKVGQHLNNDQLSHQEDNVSENKSEDTNKDTEPRPDDAKSEGVNFRQKNVKLLKAKDPLLELSDYRTGDERDTSQLKAKKPLKFVSL